jgi:hypothetical protein
MIQGAASESLTFEFTDGNVIGTRGPAYSLDHGKTWSWLGTDHVDTSGDHVRFTYAFSELANSAIFAFAPAYVESDLDRFLERAKTHPNLHVDKLCRSEEGRVVERIRVGRLEGAPKHRVLLTARHHACESMASYVLEGMLSAILADTNDGAWFRENVEVLTIPFVDKDGVENGHQGKNRLPRDHGRDYQGESLYNSTRAIRETVPAWSKGKLHFTLDIHCPHIRGESNEKIYLVGHESTAIWLEQQRFAHILEAIPNAALPYVASNDMPFGQSWNTAKNYTAGAGISHWSGQVPSVRFASAIEIPYANAGDVTITTDKARGYGATLVHAIRSYLETLSD